MKEGAHVTKNKITRVTFNSAVKPLLELFVGRDADDIFSILNAYLRAAIDLIAEKTSEPLIAKPVVFRAFIGLFPTIAQRVQDKFDGEYTTKNFSEFLTPIFSNLPMKKLEVPGTSWVDLRDYLEKRLRSKAVL
jgi:hypothetical protein